ncbi:glutathione hydrolase-like YwrD proenzyme isoform X2 [Lepisosteus oculatus]|uniref:glutathione hydrolase-like YwrD proenzyme isoform X2 n=1 Tax=Lepisosteus oculatus TaxID=7918 RepID=UPI0035F527D1
MLPQMTFSSRRSPVVCLNGCVASSQPLASLVGVDILKKGGNAADAAVAVAAALAVTEPCSTGVGGDCFCLFYDAKTREVRGLNGSGRSPRALSLDALERLGFSESSPPSPFHALRVTVPGAAAGWCDAVQDFGSRKLSLGDILQPAIDLAERGFPVAEITAHHWEKWAKTLESAGKKLAENFLLNSKAPKQGEVFANPLLAQTFKGVRLWEIPPNGQGIAALIALNILENFSVQEMGHNSADYLHVLTEALKLGVSDTSHYCADPEQVRVPVGGLLEKEYSRRRAGLISMEKARSSCEHGAPEGGDTVYFTVVDREGNACSFINSNYMGFGTGLAPAGCGFTLQNRGSGFSLLREHRNCVGPAKRPFHTIIPALLTAVDTGRLLCTFGVMGALMQPQGHVQVLLNMLEFGMNPQEALDAPRIFVQYNKRMQTWQLSLEEGIMEGVAKELELRGHRVRWAVSGHDRAEFGRGQVIADGCWWDPDSYSPEQSGRVWWAGSDPRADGCAVGY